VIDKLTKFTGEHHEPLTPGQFTQLTGRAGRRGIDERGHAIVPWSPFTSFEQVAALAGSRSFRLRSAFRPTYNMAVNLLSRLDAESARQLLARSFAQYQADSNVSRIELRLARERQRLTALKAEVAEGHGNGAVGDDNEDPEVIADAVSRLRPGDVVTGESGERLAVLGVSWRRGGRARVRLLDTQSNDVRWELAELRNAPNPIGRIDLPIPMAPDQPRFRSEAALVLRRVQLTASPGKPKRRTRRGLDPVERLRRATAEVQTLERKARSDESSIARRFDSVAAVLRERGHLDGWNVTPSGQLVARIYHESDLLVAETIASGLFDDLDPPTLASVVSVFTFEHRSPTPPPPVWFPSKLGRVRFEAIDRLAADLRRVERHHGVVESRGPEAGFATAAYAWAAGQDLSTLLDEELSAGDFVRNVKQLVDLLRQVASAAPRRDTRSSAASAADALHRGVVALSGAVGE
jgi:ATP-dependent RNA helicase HelY